MKQWFILFNGKILNGTNANSRKKAIKQLEDVMGAPFRFDKQKEYTVKRFEIVYE